MDVELASSLDNIYKRASLPPVVYREAQATTSQKQPQPQSSAPTPKPNKMYRMKSAKPKSLEAGHAGLAISTGGTKTNKAKRSVRSRNARPPSVRLVNGKVVPAVLVAVNNVRKWTKYCS